MQITHGKIEGRGAEVGHFLDLRQETSRCLYRMLRRCVPARQTGATEMSDALKAMLHTSGEELAAPDAAVVTVSGAVETHAQHSLVPLAPLGKHGGHVGAMMLHGKFFASRNIEIGSRMVS